MNEILKICVYYFIGVIIGFLCGWSTYRDKVLLENIKEIRNSFTKLKEKPTRKVRG